MNNGQEYEKLKAMFSNMIDANDYEEEGNDDQPESSDQVQLCTILYLLCNEFSRN